MEILQRSYEQPNSSDKKKPIDAASVKDFLFSFRNEDIIPSMKDRSASPSGNNMNFLNDVNIMSGSQSSRIYGS